MPITNEDIQREMIRRELEQRRGNPVGEAVKRTQGKVPSNQPLGFFESAATGLGDPLIGGRQRYKHMTGTSQEADEIDKQVREREAKLRAQGYSGIGRGVGAAVTSMPLMALGGAAGPAGAIAGGAAGGAIAGALEPVTDPNYGRGSARNIMLGGAAGAGGTAALRGVGAALAPAAQEGARELTQQGTQLTMGQTQGGLLRWGEEVAKKFPILGTLIRNRETQSMETFNLSVLNQALETIGGGVRLPVGVKAGREAIAATKQEFSKAYNTLLPQLRVQWDRDLANDVTAASFRANTLAEPQQKQFNTLVRQYVEPLSRRSAVPMQQAQSIKDVDGALRVEANRYRPSDNPDHQKLAESLDEVRDALHSAMVRQNPPQLVQALNRVDAGWAMYVRAEEAAARRATSRGVFTPADLLQTIKKQDASVRHGSFARGDALTQIYAEFGQRVLPAKMPDSGTTERLRAFDIPTGILGGALSPLYSQRGQAIARGYLNAAPASRRAARNLLRQGSGPLSIGGTPALMDTLPRRSDQ